MAKIDDYTPIVGQSTIDDLRLLAGKLAGKKVCHYNSTAVGGGVAEILNRMVPLLKELGVDTRWEVIKGGKKFYEITKKFHNALHGKREQLLKSDYEVFLETNRKNAAEANLSSDIMFVHDPQPIALVEKKGSNKWIWRCHIDVSNPDKEVWSFLSGFIKNYDAAVFSSQKFSQILPIRQFLIAPSIDPLSDKNKELSPEAINSVLDNYAVPRDKPIITQISRFDRLKDPVGVIEAYKLVKKYIDCRLVLAGGTATDDPEGLAVLSEVQERAAGDPDIHILMLPQDDIAVNALQRASSVVLQKSLKEGFGLTVAEALWKGKAVVASNVGGIPLQVTHKYSGMLCNTVEGAAFNIKQLLNHPQYAKKLGENGRNHILNNYLLTRHLKEYMLLFLSVFQSQDMVYL
ncbi:MAG TPA: glycosyl transferase family 1 [Elusimicrobia bacterium]|nr:MAG: glycosyl transferase family 1 [Elusimicrobia bacterium RIFOXYA12_FULL_49_49]OGS16225.1 MAG: glycosyl transferase family 1 [Elusimicrobia bacterium RIFOXYA2_FULL_47_53]OGS26232.1 MAG: glycosyl transferase family 1 [Elusimicrobia bacterium RIFOXYB12_FULL_50_12]OGS31380.1 MAG: glycosyl transferase family 1 [Elusimicrobia bacterium RIFOXYB2_FULL_46_23]HBU69516.1 glycosyl transferase family 1 [Elusimicrobiota bacterium]